MTGNPYLNPYMEAIRIFDDASIRHFWHPSDENRTRLERARIGRDMLQELYRTALEAIR